MARRQSARRCRTPGDFLRRSKKSSTGVVTTLDRDPLPLLLLRPEEFTLDASRAFMRAVKQSLDEGPGFAIVDRLPVDRWSQSGARAVWWLLASLVARPVAQKWDGTSIYDVCDLGRPPGNGVRPDVTNAEQNFHTDNSYNNVPPHYVGLMCLRTAMAGGVSGIVSFAAAHEEMRRHHPDLLPRLYQPFYFDRQREHAPGDVMTTYHPMFEREDGRLVARLSHFQVKNGHKLAGVELDRAGHRRPRRLRSHPQCAGHGRALPVRARPDPAHRQPRARPQAHGVSRLARGGAQAPAGAPVAARFRQPRLQRLTTDRFAGLPHSLPAAEPVIQA